MNPTYLIDFTFIFAIIGIYFITIIYTYRHISQNFYNIKSLLCYLAGLCILGLSFTLKNNLMFVLAECISFMFFMYGIMFTHYILIGHEKQSEKKESLDLLIMFSIMSIIISMAHGNSYPLFEIIVMYCFYMLYKSLNKKNAWFTVLYLIYSLSGLMLSIAWYHKTGSELLLKSSYIGFLIGLVLQLILVIIQNRRIP
jgi:hypothetical protein